MEARGPKVKNPVNLTDQEREYLLQITRYGDRPAREIHRAHILLQSDRSVPNREIEQMLQASRSTIIQIQQRYTKKGLKTSLADQKRSGRPKTWTKKDQALLLDLVASSPPAGKKRWTLRALKKRFLKRSKRDTISLEQIRQVLHAEGIDWTRTPS